MKKDRALVLLDQSRRQVAEAKTIKEAKAIADQAEAIRICLKKAGYALEIQNDAAEIKLCAERRAGALLKAMPKARGTRGLGRPKKGGDRRVPPNDAPTLSDLGVSGKQSSRWQAEAEVPEEEFAEFCADCREREREITSAGLRKIAKEHKRGRRREELDEVASAVLETEGARTGPKVSPGEWWQLGKHYLYCGDTSEPIFQDVVRRTAHEAAFAFADPPYGAGVGDWDREFVWSHDWLTDAANLVAVTPGIISIPSLFRTTEMPYRWSVSCWIDNGRARSALGFGNWIYIALFSREESIYRCAQDFVRVSINPEETRETGHRGRKPSRLLADLIEMFTDEDEWIIDPFLGSGTTLLAAERMERRCIGGEISPAFCSEIIARWEAMGGEKAHQR